MQFRLEGAQAGDIEHQAPNLEQLSPAVVHAKSVDQDVNGRPVFAPQGGLKIVQLALLIQKLGVAFALFGRIVEFGGNVDLQQFLAVGVAQHADDGVVDFDESARRSAEK